MAKHAAGITLDEKEANFVLRRTDAAGATRSITLSEDDVLRLSQAAQSLRDRILARRTPAGGSVSAAVMTPVQQVELAVDIHQSEIHLTMIDRHEARVGFSLPLEVARPLADRLPVRVSQIEAALKTTTRQ